MIQVRRISGVQVAPDGKRVAFAVRHAVMDVGKSEYLTHIHVANADGSGARQLTEGEKSCDNPEWSPDGSRIAFISARSGKRNVWIVPVGGGDAVCVTDVPTAVTSFKWLPTGDRISFTATDGPTTAEHDARMDKNDARVVDENVKLSRVYVVRAEPTKNIAANIWTPHVLSVSGTSGTGRGGYDWSPDGKRLVCAGARTPNPDDWPTARLATFGAGGVNVVRAPDRKGAAEFSPLWSPDGRWIAYVVSDDPPAWAGTGRIHVMPARGGKARPLAGTHDGWGRFSELIGWAADSKSLYYTETHGTRSVVARMTLDGSIVPLSIDKPVGVATDIHLNATRTHFGFTWQTLDAPPEAAISPVDRFDPVIVSRVNADLPRLALGRTEIISWKSKDGLEIEGLLTYPANYQAGKRYPLVLNVHGGPMGVFTQTYVATPGTYPIAAFSSRGCAVLRPNPRGSSGYGKAFRRANYGDWGGGDYQDVMAGVDHVIKLGIADENRLGIMGWSYGGYMTAWTITQTKRFKAASVGAGVTNLMSFTGTADIPSFLPDYFGGEVWDRPEAYRAHSPMAHVKGVTTPTLIQHGERDERVPLSQGQELYNALKRQGCVAKMVIYPRTPHSIDEPRLLVDCMERNLEWFDRYLGKAP
jgi:dipeptidyl aminopeptidase/acylaminoacyl peptidase